MLESISVHLDVAQPHPRASADTRITAQPHRLANDALDLSPGGVLKKGGPRARNYRRVVSLLNDETPAELVNEHVRSIVDGSKVTAQDPQDRDFASRTAVNLAKTLLRERIPEHYALDVSAVLRAKIDGSVPSDVEPLHQEMLTSNLLDAAFNRVPGMTLLEESVVADTGLHRAAKPWDDQLAQVEASVTAAGILQSKAVALRNGRLPESVRPAIIEILRNVAPHLQHIPPFHNGKRAYPEVATYLSIAATEGKAPAVSAEEIARLAKADDLTPPERHKLNLFAFTRATQTHPAVAAFLEPVTSPGEDASLEERLAHSDSRTRVYQELYQDAIGREIVLRTVPSDVLKKFQLESQNAETQFVNAGDLRRAKVWSETAGVFSAELQRRTAS